MNEEDGDDKDQVVEEEDREDINISNVHTIVAAAVVTVGETVDVGGNRSSGY